MAIEIEFDKYSSFERYGAKAPEIFNFRF